MEEVYLYGCEICQSVIFLYGDYGTSHLETCTSCHGGTFHEKIMPGVIGIGRDSHYGFKIQEKQDGSDKEK